jgi:hypothetical protein
MPLFIKTSLLQQSEWFLVSASAAQLGRMHHRLSHAICKLLIPKGHIAPLSIDDCKMKRIDWR